MVQLKQNHILPINYLYSLNKQQNPPITPPPPDCDRLNVHEIFGQKIYIRRSQSYQTLSICLFVWVFWSHSRIFHLYGDLNVTGEGFQFDLHSTVTPDTERLAVEQSLFCKCVRRKYNPAHTNTMLCIYCVLHQVKELCASLKVRPFVSTYRVEHTQNKTDRKQIAKKI